jgi:hypothetical protein
MWMKQNQKYFLNALHHAREPISMTQLIFFMWHALENYNTDKEIQQLLNSTELYVVPCINPDGYVYNYTQNSAGGSMWRKNRRLNSGGSYGVDNNRNYAYGWGGSGASATQTSDTYRGTAPFSEPENIAVRDFCNSRQFVSAFNYHAYGNYCIYPYSNVAVNNNPEIPLFNQLSVFLTEDNGFTYGNAQATVNYVASGGAEDWAYAEQTTKGKMYGFTPEVGASTDGFYPASSRIIPLCNSMIVMNKNLLKVSTKYATVTSTAASTTSSVNSSVSFTIKNFSLLQATYTVTLTPLSLAVTSAPASQTFTNIPIFQTQSGSLAYTIDPLTPSGTPLSFEISNDNGMHVRKDTIQITFVCAAPSGLSTNSITTSSANANWSALAGSTDYYVSFKTAASSTWSTDALVSGTTTSFVGLNSNTAYNWRVRGDNCSNYSATQNFTTLQTCGVPNPSASSISSSSFVLSWPAISSATTYNVQRRQQGSGTWTSTNVSGTSTTISGLAASTVYEFQVNATCPSGTSAYSAIGTATTSNIPTVSYCASNGNNRSYEWIDYIGLGSIARSSGQEAGGYVNTGLSTNLIKGNAYTITFSAGFASTVYREYWRVFIDYNGDGDFTDAGENVVNTNKTGSGNYTANFTVPSGATATTTRMRVKMNYANSSNPCGSFTYGEVEDYTVNLTTSVVNKTIIDATNAQEEVHALVMPNPFVDIISIQLEEDFEENTNIVLMDMQGKIIYKGICKPQELSHRISTSDLANGMYFLRIEQGQQTKDN